ncbi:MAG TPA: hypothetical protein VLG37_04705 [Candidatus Saccharimonadales bacterium]|nr:hypothetical protein [Candidatus Saccharimonadales bacterium]
MYTPEVSFTDPQYAHFELDLDVLLPKFIAAANDASRQRFGGHSFLNPTHISLTPVLLEQPSIVFRAWHQTSGERPAVVQPHDTVLSFYSQDGGAFMKTEGDIHYLLSASELLFIRGLTSQIIACSEAGITY